MNSSRKLVFAAAIVCLFLLALVAAEFTLMQLGTGDSGEVALSFGDRVAAILMVTVLALSLIHI